MRPSTKQRPTPSLAALTLCVGVLLVATTAHAASKRAAQPKWPAEKRCAAIFDRVAADTEAGAKKLGVRDTKPVLDRLRKQTKRWDEVCKTQPEAVLGCMETADNALNAIGSCGIHIGRKSFSDRVFLPMLASVYVPWHSHAAGAAEADRATAEKVRAAVVGSWKRQDAWAQKTLAIAADGAVTYTEIRTPKGKPASEPKVQQGKLVVQGPYMADVVMPNGMRFNWAMFRDGDRLFTSNQTGTGAYAITPGSGETLFASNGQYVIGKGLLTEVPRCFLYGPRFEPLPAHCEWQGRGDDKRLVLTREAYMSLESGSKMGEYKMRFAVVQGALVPDSWRSPKSNDAWIKQP
ncbi:MAG: hypothetical protein H6747_04970 [Deltaproteobacteria bacterium]|nr:hypothetical protein [Deltaproteobacteria bacterium]